MFSTDYIFVYYQYSQWTAWQMFFLTQKCIAAIANIDCRDKRTSTKYFRHFTSKALVLKDWLSLTVYIAEVTLHSTGIPQVYVASVFFLVKSKHVLYATQAKQKVPVKKHPLIILYICRWFFFRLNNCWIIQSASLKLTI